VDREESLSSDRPIDDAVSRLLEAIEGKNKGFILDLAKDADNEKHVIIEVRRPMPRHDEYQAPPAYRNHRIDTTDSFISFAKKYGDNEKSLVFVNEKRMVLVINEAIDKGNRETAIMTFTPSDDWNEWTVVQAEPHTHKQLLRFLMEHEHNLRNPELLAVMQSVRVNSTVDFESELTDAGDKVGIVYKTNKGEELKQFPKQIVIAVPVLDLDATEDVDRGVTAALKLDIQMPEKPGEVPRFQLSCSRWHLIYRERVQAEGRKVAEALGSMSVIAGEIGVTERKIQEI
jgi:uncharacterized protein DUF2303